MCSAHLIPEEALTIKSQEDGFNNGGTTVGVNRCSIVSRLLNRQLRYILTSHRMSHSRYTRIRSTLMIPKSLVLLLSLAEACPQHRRKERLGINSPDHLLTLPIEGRCLRRQRNAPLTIRRIIKLVLHNPVIQRTCLSHGGTQRHATDWSTSCSLHCRMRSPTDHHRRHIPRAPGPSMWRKKFTEYRGENLAVRAEVYYMKDR